MAYSTSSEAIEALASEIGDNVYIDVAKWHLYLRDAKLHTPLAERLYPMLSDGNLNESRVVETLRSILIQVGGGKQSLSLFDLVPASCQSSLMETLDDFQRQL